VNKSGSSQLAYKLLGVISVILLGGRETGLQNGKTTLLILACVSRVTVFVSNVSRLVIVI